MHKAQKSFYNVSTFVKSLRWGSSILSEGFHDTVPKIHYDSASGLHLFALVLEAAKLLTVCWGA